MANIQASASSALSASIDPTALRVTTPSITNFTATLADTEYEIALPSNTVRFRIAVRGTAKLKLAFTATESGTNYITVWPGAYYLEGDISRANTSLFVQSSKAGEIVEVVSWV